MTDVTYEIVTGSELDEVAVNFFAGMIRNRFITAEYFENRGLIELRIGTANLSRANRNAIRNMLFDSLHSRSNDVQFDEHSVCLFIPVELDWLERMNRLITFIIDACEDLSIQSGCFLCGSTQDAIRPLEIGSVRAFLCKDCVEKLNRDLRMTLQEKQSNNRFSFASRGLADSGENILAGFFGAFVGMAIGILLWFFLAQIPAGYPLAGFFLSFLIFWGYKKLASKMSFLGLLICSTMLIVSFIFSFFFSESIRILVELNTSLPLNAKPYSFDDISKSFLTYAKMSEHKDLVIQNLLLSSMLAFVAALLRFIMYSRED